MSFLQTLNFITSHPLTKDRPLAALGRFVRWQVESRTRKEVEFKWINGSKLVVRNGMTGATGNIYCGLHEFADMAFLLHFLQPDDLFVDIGANIGSYTVLASAVCNANVISIEPDPNTVSSLRRNVEINQIDDQVVIVDTALGAKEGFVALTIGCDTTNRIVPGATIGTRQVPLKRLDDVIGIGRTPVFLKLDVEGYEEQVLTGAPETLARPSLLAIATESENDQVTKILINAGFRQVYYDPFNRMLNEQPNNHRASNALFVRDLHSCQERVTAAKRRDILGQSV